MAYAFAVAFGASIMGYAKEQSEWRWGFLFLATLSALSGVICAKLNL